MKSLFKLGQVVATPGALEALEATSDSPHELIARHASGDWGELGEEDVAENEFSLHRHLRLMSAYILSDGQKLWIITEADRSVTTLLLPREY